ncbi:LacI family DNA-binding transcriptional regulator [Nocardia puris]|uniref:Phage integrase family protein n=1 Tax=Nocardia puris TaxID=208602 RepID=A0A366DMU7_9NOCA|nr:LacI family DNA-binding transcriptional regulator [Nocardia puris]RBO91376.1 phage integrase family protein [Nocardia puris]
MGYANPRSGYFEAKYLVGPGKYTTVKDAAGRVVRYPSRRAAEKAANAAEVNLTTTAPTLRTSAGSPGVRFYDYATKWLPRQDLARNTLANYRRYLECHLLPTFGDYAIGDIDAESIASWEKRERETNARSSVIQWRGLLTTILSDAQHVDKLIPANPAQRRRGRGRRRSKRGSRAAERVFTSAFGGLLVAERAALLAGRDDEFVAEVTRRFTGIRSGELWGLETQHVRPGRLRIEWQLLEVDGRLYRDVPKDESRRNIDLPHWLWQLLADHIERSRPSPCPCHGATYVFRGLPRVRGKNPRGVTMAAIAKRAGVSERAVSLALRSKPGVSEETRRRVHTAAEEIGYQLPQPGECVAHWSRESYRRWIATPAASGSYPPFKKGGAPTPVPVRVDVANAFPLTGVTVVDGMLATPVRGPRAHTLANASWLPIAEGLTPHGARHGHRTDLDQEGIPRVLIDERIGHEDGSVQAAYSHVTPDMRRRLIEVLDRFWYDALDARLALSPRSEVSVLQRLLDDRARQLTTPQRRSAA